jgi:hypothetical protein
MGNLAEIGDKVITPLEALLFGAIPAICVLILAIIVAPRYRLAPCLLSFVTSIACGVFASVCFIDADLRQGVEVELGRLFGPMVAGAAALPALATIPVIPAIGRMRRRCRRQPNCCPTCDYPLTELRGDRCPECGAKRSVPRAMPTPDSA